MRGELCNHLKYKLGDKCQQMSFLFVLLVTGSLEIDFFRYCSGEHSPLAFVLRSGLNTFIVPFITLSSYLAAWERWSEHRRIHYLNDKGPTLHQTYFSYSLESTIMYRLTVMTSSVDRRFLFELAAASRRILSAVCWISASASPSSASIYKKILIFLTFIISTFG